MPAGFFYYLLKNRAFVLAANHDGFFYRVYADLNQSVFVPWGLVRRVCVEWGDNGREIAFDVSNEVAMLPRPTHGEAKRLGEMWKIKLHPGCGKRKIKRIVAELNGLRAKV